MPRLINNRSSRMPRCRTVPPAGTPIPYCDIAQSLSLTRRGASFAQDLADDICELVGAQYGFHFSSGRCALTVTLRALRGLASSGKSEVVIPSYTCFSVASAIVRAGFTIRLCDVEPSTLDFDYDRLREVDFTRVLAIVGCNLFSVLCDWDMLNHLADGNDVFLVDDAAQSFGLLNGEKKSGMMGDVGLFSLGRGKSLTAYSGGIVVTREEAIARQIEKELPDLGLPSRAHDLAMALRTAAYGLFLKPALYWIPNSLPFTGLGETVFDPGFQMTRLGEFQGRIGRIVLSKIEALNSLRLSNSRKLIESLSAIDSLEIPGSDLPRGIPYLRLPVLTANRAIRDQAVEILTENGLGASSMYPSPINEIIGITGHLSADTGEFPGARELSDRLMTLPTHPYVTATDIVRIVEILEAVESGE